MPYECKICGLPFDRHSGFLRHVKAHNNPQPKDRECPECQEFFSASGITLHRRWTHG